MRILYVVADNPQEWNSSEWRCAIPARVINSMPGHSAAIMSIEQFANSINEGSAEMQVAAKSDLIFYQRNYCWPEMHRIGDYWRGIGKAFIVDLDDDYLALPAGNKAIDFWRADDSKHLKALKEGLRHANALSSPSKVILEKWQAEGVTRSLWLPNFAQGSWYENLVKKPHEGFWVGWGGSHSHFDTWFRSGCGEGLRLACEARPDIRVVVCGSDKRVLGLVPVPDNKKLYGGFVDPKDVHLWPTALCQFDIGVAPLGGQFDQSRSWLKVLEYALAKVPFVASDGAPYAELGRLGAVVDDKPENWARAIIDARDNYAFWRARAEQSYKLALEYTMERQAGRYIETLWKIVQRHLAESGAVLPGILYV